MPKRWIAPASSTRFKQPTLPHVTHQTGGATSPNDSNSESRIGIIPGRLDKIGIIGRTTTDPPPLQNHIYRRLLQSGSVALVKPIKPCTPEYGSVWRSQSGQSILKRRQLAIYRGHHPRIVHLRSKITVGLRHHQASASASTSLIRSATFISGSESACLNSHLVILS